MFLMLHVVVMETCMPKTAFAKLADNLNDIPLLFPPLKHIAFEIASLLGIIYWLWKHL